MSMHVTSHHQETEQLGYELASLLDYQKFPIVLLDGPLAAGKTTFTKGIGRALEIKKTINSPSFTLMKMYASDDQSKHLYHFDLYRMESGSEDYDLEEYMHADAFVVVEWPYQVPILLPDKYVKVTFRILSDTQREIEITCHADYCVDLEQLKR